MRITILLCLLDFSNSESHPHPNNIIGYPQQPSFNGRTLAQNAAYTLSANPNYNNGYPSVPIANNYISASSFRAGVNTKLKTGDTPATLKEIEESYADSLIHLNGQPSSDSNTQSQIYTENTGQNVYTQRSQSQPEVQVPSSTPVDGYVETIDHHHFMSDYPTTQLPSKEYSPSYESTPIIATSSTPLKSSVEYGHHLKSDFKPSLPYSPSYLSPSFYKGFKPSFGPPIKATEVASVHNVVADLDYAKLPGYPSASGGNFHTEISIHVPPAYEDHIDTTESKSSVNKVHKNNNKVIYIKRPQGKLLDPLSQTGTEGTIHPHIYIAGEKEGQQYNSDYYAANVQNTEALSAHQVYEKMYSKPSWAKLQQSLYSENGPTLPTPYFDQVSKFSSVSPTQVGAAAYTSPILNNPGNEATAQYAYFDPNQQAPTYHTVRPFIPTLKSPRIDLNGEVVPIPLNSNSIQQLTNLIRPESGFMMTYAPTYAPYTTVPTSASTPDPLTYSTVDGNAIEELLRAYGIEPSHVEISREPPRPEDSRGSGTEESGIGVDLGETEEGSDKYTRSATLKASVANLLNSTGKLGSKKGVKEDSEEDDAGEDYDDEEEYEALKTLENVRTRGTTTNGTPPPTTSVTTTKGTRRTTTTTSTTTTKGTTPTTTKVTTPRTTKVTTPRTTKVTTSKTTTATVATKSPTTTTATSTTTNKTRTSANVDNLSEDTLKKDLSFNKEELKSEEEEEPLYPSEEEEMIQDELGLSFDKKPDLNVNSTDKSDIKEPQGDKSLLGKNISTTESSMTVPLYFEAAKMTDDEKDGTNETISSNENPIMIGNNSTEISEMENSSTKEKKLGKKIRIKPSVARSLKGHKRIRKVKKPNKNKKRDKTSN